LAAAVLDVLAAHRETVRGVVLRVVRDEALAEDLVQEALLRATRAAGGLRGDAAPGTWLTAIALNLMRDHFRSRKRLPVTGNLELAESVADPFQTEMEVMRAEMSACILEHIARLKERQREAVLLQQFAGLGHREIAAALGVTENNARVLVHRAMQALRISLGKECILDFADCIPCERRPNP
jgi:RNA polymerase sigma-70 factor, ECF subfamily